MCSKSHTKYTVYEKLGLIVSITPKQHAVMNRATSVRHNLQYVRQCGKSRESVCKTWESLKPTRFCVVSMYKLTSSTLYFMDISRRSLKKVFTLRRRRQKSEDAEADWHVKPYLWEGKLWLWSSVTWHAWRENLPWWEKKLILPERDLD